MKLITIRKKECIGRVVLFGAREDVVFTIDDTDRFAELGTVQAVLDAAATQQSSGNLAFRETADERAFAATELRTAMRDVAEIAKALDKRGFDVGALEGFRMPRPGKYADLAAKGNAFAEQAEPRKALFISRGLAATFVEDLKAKAAALLGKGDGAGSELSRQVGGTNGADQLADLGMDIVRELRASMRVKLRDNPVVQAEWNSLARVHATPRRSKSEPPASEDPGSGTGSGSGS